MKNFLKKIKAEKPKRRYKSFRHYIDTILDECSTYYSKFQIDFPDKYPCIECESRGWIYDPEDGPCPIEGNKCRHRITCIRCKGNKLGTKKEYKILYKNIVARDKEALAKWKTEDKQLKDIQSKLTINEQKFLALYLK